MTATNVPQPDYCRRSWLFAPRAYPARMNNAYTVLGLLCAVLLFGLAACEREGPAEKAGEAVDRAARDVRDAVRK
jgi:hypothetical protein